MRVDWSQVDLRWPSATAVACLLLVVGWLWRVHRAATSRAALQERVGAVESLRRWPWLLLSAAVGIYAVAVVVPGRSSTLLVCAVVTGQAWTLTAAGAGRAARRLHGGRPAPLGGPFWLRALDAAVHVALAVAAVLPVLAVPAGTATAAVVGAVTVVWVAGLRESLRVRLLTLPLDDDLAGAPDPASQGAAAFAAARGVRLRRFAATTDTPPYVVPWVVVLPPRRWVVLNEPAGTSPPGRAFLVASGAWWACAPGLWMNTAWAALMTALLMFVAPRSSLAFVTALWVCALAQSASSRVRHRRTSGPSYVETMGDVVGVRAAHEAMRDFARRSGTAELPAMQLLLDRAEQVADDAPVRPSPGVGRRWSSAAGSWVIDTTACADDSGPE